MSAARYIIRRWRDGQREVLTNRGWARAPLRYDDRETAESYAKDHAGDPHVVRLLTRDEAKRKAAAEALRECADRMRVEADDVERATHDGSIIEADTLRRAAKKCEVEADALWPRKGAGRG